ncbi:hypothetical protein [Nitrospirillum pindoramense]|uniref:Type II secretion system (T2SS) protein M subtype b n=1 Tax=Nitrospirillum amazonense TaxID=28077 RepID=A0A560H410_9PROT|nr:hypothetical protein [Nitrospirillum amazonense]TWB41023.1 hypothetical protein FBZ90_10847 [Nitrospirillum amazonense]
MRAPILSPATLLLHGRLALGRAGWSTIIAWALLLGGTCACVGGLPYLRVMVAQRQADLDLAATRVARAAHAPAPPAPPPPLAQRNLQAFYDALGDVRYAEQDLAVLFDEAARQGLTLVQGDYKLAYDKAGLFYTYVLQLPVTGRYAAIRDFSRQMLVSVPYLALDEISIKRQAVGDASVEARLRLTLYLDGPADYLAAPSGVASPDKGHAP